VNHIFKGIKEPSETALTFPLVENHLERVARKTDTEREREREYERDREREYERDRERQRE